MQRRFIATLAATLLALGTASASANDYPSKPVTVIVPQAAGGSNDIVGRLIAQKLGETLPGAVVVENRPGAGGNIGTVYVAKAPKDGHTLLMTISSAQAINPAVYKNPGFDPVKDFTPLALVGSVPNVLVVNPAFPAKNLADFLKLVKANPGKYPYASAGVKLQHIPYKGVAPAMTDVIGGQVPMAFTSLPSVLQHLKAGRLVAIGVSSPSRSPVLPDVPAIGEQVPGYSGTLWVGLFAARGTPPEIEGRLQDAMKKVLAASDTQEKLQAQGVELANATPAQFAALLQEDITRWARIVKESGATID